MTVIDYENLLENLRVEMKDIYVYFLKNKMDFKHFSSIYESYRETSFEYARQLGWA